LPFALHLAAMLVEARIKALEEGRVVMDACLTIQGVLHDGQERLELHYELQHYRKSLVQGVMKGPRPSHPDLPGRMLAVVVRRLFPLVPENRYS
jgi:hypothetical protein